MLMTILNLMLGRSSAYDEASRRYSPGTVEVEDPETGEVTLRRATEDEREYARRVIRHIEGSLDGPPPVKPWGDEPAEARSWGDEHGVESGHVAPLELAPPPFWMPPAGICCAGCPGYDDKRCCARS